MQLLLLLDDLLFEPLKMLLPQKNGHMPQVLKCLYLLNWILLL
jgi:hypothetical protein